MANGLSLWDKPKADKFIRNDAGPGDARLTACARLNAMQELLTRTWDMLVGREHGPLAFRLVIQPMAGAFLAIRAGVKDAREGRPPHYSPIRFTGANSCGRAGMTSPGSSLWRS